MVFVVKVNRIDTQEMEATLWTYDSLLDAEEAIRADWEEEYNNVIDVLWDSGVIEELTYYEGTYAKITTTKGETLEWQVLTKGEK